MKKIDYIVIFAIAYVVTCIIIFRILSFVPDAEIEIFSRNQAFTKSHDLVLLSKDAGATTDTAWHVVIVRKNSNKIVRTLFVSDSYSSNSPIDVSYDGANIYVYKLETCNIYKSEKYFNIDGQYGKVIYIDRRP